MGFWPIRARAGSYLYFNMLYKVVLNFKFVDGTLVLLCVTIQMKSIQIKAIE